MAIQETEIIPTVVKITDALKGWQIVGVWPNYGRVAQMLESTGRQRRIMVVSTCPLPT